MRVYLDNNLDSNELLGLLQQSGHDAVSPRTVGTPGIADEEHLRYASSNSLVIITANALDFIELQERWQIQQQQHSGILIVFLENNPGRDMAFQEIARAVTQIEGSGIPLANRWHNLNFWRW